MKENEKRLLDGADIVFTGGKSLYLAKKSLHANIYSFPSSIDKTHFSQARKTKNDPDDQRHIPHPRIGFYGVIDERMDLDLLGQLADMRPLWQFILVGPVVKIDTALLPRKKNVHYLGKKNYEDLPAYLAGWDIAMMPFALNESTRYISPTKTPEYLAGGKPVISPSIVDVVDPYGELGLVRIADTPGEFVGAAEDILNSEASTSWLKKVDSFLEDLSWDRTVSEMSDLIASSYNQKKNISEKINKSYV